MTGPLLMTREEDLRWQGYFDGKEDGKEQGIEQGIEQGYAKALGEKNAMIMAMFKNKTPYIEVKAIAVAGGYSPEQFDKDYGHIRKEQI